MLNELTYKIVYKIFGPRKYKYRIWLSHNKELFNGNGGPRYLHNQQWIEKVLEIIERQREEKNQYRTVLMLSYNLRKKILEINEITAEGIRLLAEVSGEYDEGCYFGPRIINYGFDWFEIDLIKTKFNQYKEIKRLDTHEDIKLFFEYPVT